LGKNKVINAKITKMLYKFLLSHEPRYRSLYNE
jgi:hypothetical protein